MTPSWHCSSLITCLVRPPFARHDWTCGIVPRRTINVLKPIQNVSHFADDIFKLIFLYQNCCILIQISNDPVNNKPALVKMVKLLLKLAPQIVREVITYPCPNFYSVLTKLYVDALNQVVAILLFPIYFFVTFHSWPWRYYAWNISAISHQWITV